VIMRDLYDALRQVVQLLDELQIPYVVMGGIAARVLGIPRPTHDVDFTLVVDRPVLLQLFDRLEALGFTIAESYRKCWIDRVEEMPLVKARMYLDGRGVDVDMFLCESTFQESLISRRQRQNVEGIELWMVTPEDLILLKLLAGRTRDWADVGDVLFMQGELDTAYMRHWAKQLEIEPRLEKALAEAANQE
jgi:predicted nucleotidyltransferase